MTELHYFTADDGAKIAYRDEGAGFPVLALSGLTRSGTDFDYLAPFLPNHRLIRMDYRGRGGSDWTGAESYTVPREAADAVQLLDHLGVERAAILGTSRGGMVGMFLAATAKPRVAGLCLNDVGPELTRGGLERIFDYLGRNPAPKTPQALAEKLPTLMTGFANVPEGRWLEEVSRHYIATLTGLKINYDPALRESFLAAFNGPEIDLWPLFDTCAGLPLALIRGANSDLLSEETAAKMQARRPDMMFAEIPDRAHIPFLDEPEAVALVRAWLAECEGA